MSDDHSTRTLEDLRAERLAALNLMEDAIASREALAEEKYYAESIVDTLHEPLLVLHSDLTVKSVNPAFYTHFQVNPADTIGRKVYELGNGQWNIPELRTLLEDVLPDSNVFNDHEVTHEFETIGRRVMLLNGRRLDHVQLILLGIRDITERKRAEEALRASEEKYRTLFDSIDEGFCIFEMIYRDDGQPIDFRYIETNPGFERQTGRRPKPGQTMRELFPEAEDMWLDKYAEVARTAEPKRFVDYQEQLDRWYDIFVFPAGNGSKHQLAALFSDVTEGKRAEVALRESQARLHKAISIQTVGVLFFSLDGTITDANEAFLRMVGHTLDQLRGLKNVEQLTAPEFIGITRRTARNIIETGKTPPYEKQMVRPDGSRWWGLFAPTRLSGTGKQSECVEFVVDITDQKTYEAELRESEERFRSIVNQNVAGILQIDLAGKVLFANQQFCLSLDRPLNELLELNLRDFIHPDDLPENLRLLRKMARDGKPFEVEKRLLRSDGSAFWVHHATTPVAGADGEIRLATITSLDINARREAEEALRANEEQFRRAVEEAPIPVIMHAEDGQVLQISRTWTELTGYKPEDIPTFEAWLNRAYGRGAKRVREHMHKLFHGQVRTLSVEMDVETRQGERRRWAFSASAPGTLRDGRRYIVGMAVDITERAEELRAANKELRELSKRLVVAQEDERRKLALELHDEVGQQLTGLNMLLHRLCEHDDGKTKTELKEIRDAAQVVADTLRRVRKISVDLRPAALDDLGLGMAVRAHVDTFSKQTGIRVRLTGRDLPENKLSPEVRITGFRVIQEALTNVARHAKTKNATVTMSVSGGELRLRVSDAGRGFSLERQQKKHSSGLSGMRERVTLSGGQFSIESAPNRGTRVAATLPLNDFGEKK